MHIREDNVWIDSLPHVIKAHLEACSWTDMGDSDSISASGNVSQMLTAAWALNKRSGALNQQRLLDVPPPIGRELRATEGL